jgi:hypothetical protein
MFGLFKKKSPKHIKKTQSRQTIDRGFLVFDHTSDVIQAETLLKKSGWKVRVMGPPPEIQTGCDLVIEIPLIEKLNIMRALSHRNIIPVKVVPVDNPLLEPVSLFHTRDYGDYLMVRAANMKITIKKMGFTIVNISGGGCPDVPYLAQEMIGKTLYEAPHPKIWGHTLCGYALALAHEELCKQCLPS